MDKMDTNGRFFLNLNTAEEAFHFMTRERYSAWKDIVIQNDGTITVVYGLRQARDEDYRAIRHEINR